ncbi:hypothetical protein L6452_22186 [Arctium lappa]|uniref:Uncharacterized protein n=1 Tax=Arctium lappa TaxID=4217 RepID=A0ACB9AYA5_ARCLA|nr:hypothetical protein L6452_22186 [Arctium lappa]
MASKHIAVQQDENEVQNEHNDPSDNVSREAPMPSVPSSGVNLSVHHQTPNEVFPYPLYVLHYKTNNYYVDFDKMKIDPVIRAILHGHPIAPTLSLCADVPEVYLQQAWHSITKNELVRPHRFEVKIDQFDSYLTYNRLRLILELPEANSRPGRNSYDSFPPESDSSQKIQSSEDFSAEDVPEVKPENDTQITEPLWSLTEPLVGSQSKPPTLIRDEYPQWKIRMVHFLDGVDPGLVEFLHNPPFIPMTIVPHVPATVNTPEVPEYQHPKPIAEWSEEERTLHDFAKKTKRLIIMAIPNDIIQSLDSCETSKDLWLELEKQLEGGAKTLKNNRALCINEYFSFKALSGESIQSTYNRYNSLINKCKRYGIHRTSEENNVRFLQSLNDEWLHLTMSMQGTLDLDVWSISDLFGTLISQENRISKLTTSVGGPLALVGSASEGKDKGKKDKAAEDTQRKKKKKVLIAESESE